MRKVSLQHPHNPNNLNVPSLIFQQDNASLHISYQIMEFLAENRIKVLEHPSNSPNMNAIKKAQMPMRIEIINVWNCPYTLEQTARAWYAKQEALEQDIICRQISEIVENNQQILDNKGGNKFHR